MLNKTTTAEWGMVFVTILWASCYVVSKIAMEGGLTPNWLTALRFLGAAVVLAVVFRGKLRLLDRHTLRGGSLIGLTVGAGYILQTVGLTMTTASKVGFLTSLYVVLVPILDCSLKRALPKSNEVAGITLATIGLAVLCLNGELSVSIGDALVFLGAVFFAVSMILVDRYSGPCDPMLLSMVQITVAGVLALVCALATEPIPAGGVFEANTVLWIIYLILFGTAVNTAVQNLAQSIIVPIVAALIFVLEPIFSGIFGFFILSEPMGLKELSGSALIIGGMLITLLVRPGKRK